MRVKRRMRRKPTPKPVKPPTMPTEPTDYVSQYWFIVFRGGHTPVAAFPLQSLAEDFKSLFPHRNKDTISPRQIMFKY